MLNNRCAPGIIEQNGTCINIQLLIDMANAYNLVNNDKIVLNENTELLDSSNYQKYLLDEFEKRLSSICGPNNQSCWLTQPFINKLKDKAHRLLTQYTFRANGPTKKNEWLNNQHIYNCLIQYENKFKNFSTYPPLPIDFAKYDDILLNDFPKFIERLNHKKATIFGIVFNLDKRYNNGTHWVSLFVDLNKGLIYYFDSVGIHPPKEIKNFITLFSNYFTSKQIPVTIKYNKIQHQYANSECGVYSMNFIIRLLEGDTFDNIVNNPIQDDEINTCRLKYFN